ncbi:hypothetical protein E4T56_gene4227, partial [Termitomyces sp. T112]
MGIGPPRHACGIEHAAHHHRGGLHPPRGAQFSHPCKAEARVIGGGDLRKAAVMRLARIAAGVGPLRARALRRRLAGGAGHAIGHGDEIGLDLTDHAMVDFEQFGDVEGMRAAHRAIDPAPVGQLIALQFARMVDEAEGQHEAAFLVHQGEAARAQFIVIAVIAHAELFLTAQRGDGDDLGKIGVTRGLHAVFHPVAIRGKARVDRAVIQLQRVEIAVGEAHHFGAIHRGLGVAFKDGLGPIAWVFKLDARLALPHAAHFAFADLARSIDGKAQGEGRLLDGLDDRADVAAPA